MNDSMRSFTVDIESRLDRALKVVGSKDITKKKYGFDTSKARNVEEFMSNDDVLGIHKDTLAFNRKMNKMQQEANNFIAKINQNNRDLDLISQKSLPKI